MSDIFSELTSQLPAFDSPEWLTNAAAVHLRTFTFVAARLGGFVLLLPFVTGSRIARHLQIIFVLLLALVLTPAVSAITPAIPQPAPFSADWCWTLGVEFVLGLALGLGVMLCLSAFQMAGELVDQQMGLRPQQILLQSDAGGSSVTGQFLFLLGLACFLTLPPVGAGDRGGLLLLVDSFMQMYQTLPVGFGNLPDSLGMFVIGSVQHSVALALLVAAPILSCAMLVAMFVSVLNRSMPAANTIQIGFPLRIVVCLTVLLLTLSGQTMRVTQEIPRVLEDLRTTLSG